MLIINAPLSFRGVWAVIRPWLDKKTQAKVEIFGGNYMNRVKELIAQDQLPQIIGGTCDCTGKYPNGDSCLNPVRDIVKSPTDQVPDAWPTFELLPTNLPAAAPMAVEIAE